MTNNDELAIKMKAKASLALEAWNKFTSLSDDVDLERGLSLYEMSLLSAHDSASNPAHILALLAERDDDKKRIGDMQAIVDAAEKLVRCKGRYHSEQNYRALAALFGVKTPDLPPLDTETLTVSVKFPESVIDAICLTAAEIHNLGRGVSDERAQEIINSIRCAAGIKLEVGE